MATTSDSVRCCNIPGVEAAADYGELAVAVGSAKSFLERAGLIPTLRRPRPRMEPSANRVHSMTLKPPLPLPELLRYLDGDPPPDRGLTQEWPHPSAGAD